MSLQSDINWVQNEVGKVTSPKFLEVIKNLLLYRQEAREEERDTVLTEKLISRALKSEEDIKTGRVYDFEAAEKRVKSRLGL